MKIRNPRNPTRHQTRRHGSARTYGHKIRGRTDGRQGELEFAVGRVPVAKLSTGEIERMLSEGAPWRELMLSYLEIASHPLIGLLPQERVVAVRAGRGKLDQAQDFVALPGLFAEFAQALAGKHPFPADKLDLLSMLGGTLVQNVKPGNIPT